MGNHWNRNVYKETTDSRTFCILHITTETGCCLKCAKRHKQKGYGSPGIHKWPMKNPSWKLVSKNKKQWMKKSLDYSYKKSTFSYNVYCEITW